MAKSADAFRTISEVADWLETPAHVLRFWESKFSQVKPVKRAGGRRYYRPADMKLLGGIKKLLHQDGLTIKGVQKILREKGVKHVAGFSQPLEGALDLEAGAIALDVESVPADSADVVSFNQKPEPIEAGRPEPADGPAEDVPAATEDGSADAGETGEGTGQPAAETAGLDAAPAEADSNEAEDSAPEPAPTMPSFTHLRDKSDAPAGPGHEPETADQEKPAPVIIEVPDDPEDDVSAPNGVLTAIHHLPHPLPQPTAHALAPLLERLKEVAGHGPDNKND